jgi:threonine dehydratase
VVLHGDVYDDAFAYAKQLEQQQDLVFIHPYDDIEVIAGQATIAKELLEQNPKMDRIFIPVGGGGLMCSTTLPPSCSTALTLILGVESGITITDSM